MTDTREQLTVVLLTALMVLSLVAIAGTGLAGSVAATEHSDAQSAVDADEPASIDTELEEASGTEQVYIVLDQYDGQLSDDRDRAIAQLQEHAELSQTAAAEDIDAFAGVDVINTYWITNAIRAEVDTNAVDTAELATIDGAETIQLRPEYEVPEPEPSVEPALESDDDEYTYGLDQVNASETWADFDTQGEDVKVAVLD
ncbi:peptidase S8 and S53 subtilisin kexin sedolisin, partial [Natrialba chahannaoensis JCM 10990]